MVLVLVLITELHHANQLLRAAHFQLLLLRGAGPGSIVLVIGLGLILGMRHATDADHLVALSTIVSKQRSVRRAAVIGSVWGLGHTVTIFVVGSFIVLFGVHIPTRLGLSMEFSVAVMLVVLGVLNLTGLTQRVTTHFTTTGRKVEQVDRGTLHRARGSIQEVGLYHYIRPLVIGLIHGLAGSAAVALLVLSTIRRPLWAAAYLLIFGVGTILGMMLMTTAVAVPLTYGGRRFAALNRYLAVASGVVSLCFGLFLVYQLGFVGGLFGPHPQWTPH